MRSMTALPAALSLALAPLLLAACSPQAPSEAASTPAPAVTEAATAASSPDAAAPTASEASTPLQPGAQAPDFSAKAWLAGEPFEFRLADALAKGPVVVYFFPAAFTPGCNLEARLFSESMDEFQARGANVIGVTAGNADQLAEFSSDNETCSGKFAVAADPDASIAARYGAAMAERSDRTSRTSFAIGRDGRILRVHSDMQPEQHVSQMLEGLQG